MDRIGFELSLYQEQFTQLGIDKDPYLVFLSTIPSRFFPILMLCMIASTIYFEREFGPMWRYEYAHPLAHSPFILVLTLSHSVLLYLLLHLSLSLSHARTLCLSFSRAEICLFGSFVSGLTITLLFRSFFIALSCFLSLCCFIICSDVPVLLVVTLCAFPQV